MANDENVIKKLYPTDENKTEQYIKHINSHILPFVDYAELDKSYKTDMAYAKGILNRLHEAMVGVYGSEYLDEQDGDEGFVVIPGVVRGTETGNMALALLDLDLSSSGEHWGTAFLCKFGVVSQNTDRMTAAGKAMGKAIGSYDYWYTASLPGDIHVEEHRLPESLKNVIKDFRNHNVDLLFNEEYDETAEYVGTVSYASGEEFNYTDADKYIKVIEEELPYRATSGFSFKTLTDDGRGSAFRA